MQVDESLNCFKVRDASSYDDVTESFDRFTERFSLQMADEVIYRAKIQPCDRVLDVGTGTGVLAWTAARSVRDCKITGIDLSCGMLATATHKASEEGLHVEFRSMDAEMLEFQSGSFDVVVSLYALCHFPNPEKALVEMHRVLVPGGRIAIGVGSAPRLLTLDGIKAGLHHVSAMIRGLVGRGDYVACQFMGDLVEKHLPQIEPETAEWADYHEEKSRSIASMMKHAGFRNVYSSWVGQRSIIESPDEFWELQATFSSFARKRIGSSDPERVAELERLFFDKCNTHLYRGGRMIYSNGAAILYASRN